LGCSFTQIKLKYEAQFGVSMILAC